MTDRGKVMRGLEICSAGDVNSNRRSCTDCPFYPAGYTGCSAKRLLSAALEIMKAQEPGWISVEDRLPVETHSIFWPWYGKKEWSKAMWRENSDKVLVTVKFKDGSEVVTTGETHDGVWHTTISRTLEPVVTHWMPLPEPPKEG